VTGGRAGHAADAPGDEWALHDTLKFPAAAAGMPLTFQAVVHTRLGSITLDWPVTVRP
jgi:hypothetical protein